MQLEDEQEEYEQNYRRQDNYDQNQQLNYLNQQNLLFQEKIQEKEAIIEDQNILLNQWEGQQKTLVDNLQNYISEQKKTQTQYLEENKQLRKKVQEIEGQQLKDKWAYKNLERHLKVAKQQKMNVQDQYTQKIAQQANTLVSELNSLHEEENLLSFAKMKEVESQLKKERQINAELQRDFEIAKQQQTQLQEEITQKYVQQTQKFGHQISELKQIQEEENKTLQDKVKENENQLKKEKLEKAQLQRDLEVAKQQSIKQQEETNQKIALQTDNFKSQNNELKKLHEQIKHLQDKLQENEAQLKQEKQVNIQLQTDSETLKQQSIKQQEESTQKIAQEANNLWNQISESKKLQEQVKNLLDKLKENESQLKKEKQVNTQLQKDQETLKQTIKQQEERNQQILQQANYEINQYDQEYKCLLDKVKEIEGQLEKEKQVNAQLQRDLLTLKQQSIKTEEESLQKIVDDLSFDSNLKKGDDLNKEVTNILKKLNPNTEIVTNQVEFTKMHQIVVKNQPDEKQKSILKVRNDQLVQSYKQNLTSNQQNNQSNSNSSGVMPCLLALQSMYQQDGVQTFITDQPIKNLEKEDKIYQIQQDILQSGLHNQASYYSLEINKKTNLYQDLLKSSSNQNITSFVETFKNEIGKSVNSQNPQNDVTILKIGLDKTPKIDFQINSKDLSKNEIKKKLTLSDIGASVSEKNLLENAKLSIDMFNPQYNMTWTDQFKGKQDTRGQLKFFNQANPVNHPYNFPVGYTGYALNIERYGADKSWISSNADDKTWIVLFHGTNENFISGITKNNLKPGSRNMFGGTLCRITNTTIKNGANANVYLTDSMDVAEQFATISSTYEGKKYIIIFQCRVNPKGVKSPKDKQTYYTVDDNANIRPYRILLKQIK